MDDFKYECYICHKSYRNPLLAESCRKSHEVIYIPVKKSDLVNLMQFFITHDERLISEELFNVIKKAVNRR